MLQVERGTRLVETFTGGEACQHDDPCLTALAIRLSAANRARYSFPGVFVQRFDYRSVAEAPADSYWKTGPRLGHWDCRVCGGLSVVFQGIIGIIGVFELKNPMIPLP